MKYKIVLTDELLAAPLAKSGAPLSSYVSHALDAEDAIRVLESLDKCGVHSALVPVY